MDTPESQSTMIKFRSLPENDPETVIAQGAELLGTIHPGDAPRECAEISYRIGLAKIAKGEYESAFFALSEARHLHDAQNMPKEALLDLMAFGTIYGLSEQPEAAFETFLSIRDTAQKEGYVDIEEIADRHMGRICFDQGRSDEGRSFIEASLKLNMDTGSAVERASSLHELGRIELHSGRLEEATQLLEEAKDLFEFFPGTYVQDFQITLGDLYTRTGRYPEAERQLVSALEYCSAKGISHGRLMALFHLGNLREAMEKDSDAVRHWESCFRNTDTTMLRHLKVKSGEKLVDHCKKTGSHAEALRFLEEVRSIEQAIRDERLHHTISVHDQSLRIDDLEQEMQSWRRRSNELEQIRMEKDNSIRELETIKSIGEKITASLDPDTIIQVIHDTLSQLMAVDSLGVGFYSSDTKIMDFRYLYENGIRKEPATIEIRPDMSLASWVLSNDEDLLIHNRRDAAEYAKALTPVAGSRMRSESFLFVRLKIERITIGVMTVQAQDPNRYSDRHLKVLKALGGFIAVALANSSAHQNLVEANEKIAYMATHDPLTDLPNRMQIMNRLGQELERCKRYGQSLAVLFIDLDGFKEINDTHGHRAGDEVLKVIALRLSEGIRGTDAVGRLAGDEFLVILTDDCSPYDGKTIADQIRRKTAMEIPFEGKSLSVTASIGMAFHPNDGIDAGTLVNAADQAMYSAKAEGKNRTVIHQKEPV